ncbi:MAG: hypothetical protein NVSMB62_27380 [Acidobacteriaceae bacterium]
MLFSREAPAPSPDSQTDAPPKTEPAPPATPPVEPELLPTQSDPLHVSEVERTSLTATAYALDLHLAPASHGLAARAALTVRNDGAAPLTRLVLQISSSLHWDALSIARPGAPLERLPRTTRRLATDSDHTGFASEIIATLPQPLPPGASLPLVAIYSGAIPQSAERLERIGAPAAQAAAADWDTIAAPAASSSGTSIALRGFGDVLWYPVSAPPVFLGDGARLFDLAGRTRLREEAATISLRLAIEFSGDAPSTVFFCGRPQPLNAVRDNPDAPNASGTGIATASFGPQPLGFRVPSLFVTDHPSSPVGTEANPDLIATTTEHFDALLAYSTAAKQVEPLLTEWLGPHPLAPLHLLDHAGQPFEDGALLVRPIGAEAPATLTASLAHSLTHAWIHSEHPWIDEGLAQFLTLLWTERTQGRPAVIAQLQDSAHTVALAEPDTASTPHPEPALFQGSSSSQTSSSSVPAGTAPAAEATSGQPLVHASSDVFFRTKAAAVWWMLRGVTGDDALKQALKVYRQDPKLDTDPAAFQHLLERASRQDLRWFFDDWVYRDRGLPDLTVVNVTPRQLEGTARSGGWLVSVEVRNDGDCVADVPVTIRSATGAKGSSAATETQRLRIPGHGTVTRRIVFPVPPAEVQVNDGTTPETRVSVHTEHIGPPAP